MVATVELPRTNITSALDSLTLHTEVMVKDTSTAFGMSNLERWEVEMLGTDLDDPEWFVHSKINVAATIKYGTKTFGVGQASVTIIDAEGESLDDFNECLRKSDNNDEVYIILSTLEDVYEDDIIYGDCDIFRGKIAILNILEVYPEYQRQGLGRRFIRKLVDYLKGEGMTYLYLVPAPLQSTRRKVTWERQRENLIKFYRKCGFKVLACTDSDDYVAILKL